jgi:hypothetical protein
MRYAQAMKVFTWLWRWFVAPFATFEREMKDAEKRDTHWFRSIK